MNKKYLCDKGKKSKALKVFLCRSSPALFWFSTFKHLNKPRSFSRAILLQDKDSDNNRQKKGHFFPQALMKELSQYSGQWSLLPVTIEGFALDEQSSLFGDVY